MWLSFLNSVQIQETAASRDAFNDHVPDNHSYRFNRFFFCFFFFNWNSFQELLSHCYCWLSVVITVFCLIKSKWTLQLSVVTVISCLVFLPNKDSWSCYETGSVVAKLLLCVLMSYRLGWGGSIKQRNLRLFSSSSSGQQSSSCPCHNW